MWWFEGLIIDPLFCVHVCVCASMCNMCVYLVCVGAYVGDSICCSNICMMYVCIW